MANFLATPFILIAFACAWIASFLRGLPIYVLVFEEEEDEDN